MLSSLSSRDRVLCAIYAVVLVAALIGTQSVLVGHLVDGGSISAFTRQPVDTAGGVFVTIDLLAVAVAALVLMIAEARRLGLRHVWVYVVLTFAVAVSVAFPAFLIHRQVHLARNAS